MKRKLQLNKETVEILSSFSVMGGAGTADTRNTCPVATQQADSCVCTIACGYTKKLHCGDQEYPYCSQGGHQISCDTIVYTQPQTTDCPVGPFSKKPEGCDIVFTGVEINP